MERDTHEGVREWNPGDSKRLRKVVIQVEILMEENDDHTNMSLSEIEHECLDGDWSYGGVVTVSNEIIEGEEACVEACNKQGTDIEFFFYDF